MGHIAQLTDYQSIIPFAQFSDYHTIIFILKREKTSSPFENCKFLICKNLCPLQQRMLYAKFGWNWHSDSGEADFIILWMHYRFFVIISPWKKARQFIWMNLKPLYPRMFCINFGWNSLRGSGEEDFKIWSMYFLLFRYYVPVLVEEEEEEKEEEEELKMLNTVKHIQCTKGPR